MHSEIKLHEMHVKLQINSTKTDDNIKEQEDF